MKKNILKYLLIVCAFILILDGYMSKNALEIKHYTISDNRLKSSFKLVLLSDLHNSEFGEQNERLIAKIDSVKPDIIFIAGDLIDFKIKDKQIALNLIEKLSAKYPVYISLGNHEAKYDELFSDQISKDYENAGATVLNFDYVDLHIGKNDIRLGGLNGYCLPEPDCGISDWLLHDAEFIRDFENTDKLKLLLCHMPAAWLKSGSLYEYDVDYIFSGHVHGGQIRLPVIGGLWAPDLGWFPGKVCGLYYTNQEDWI